MPIIEQNPGWSNALAGLITAYGISQGAKNAKQEKQRQQGIDAQNTAIANAQLAQDQANTIKTYTDMGYTKNPKTNQWEATPVTLPPAPKGTPGTPAVQGIVKGRHVIKSPAKPGTPPTDAQLADYYLTTAASLAQTRPDLAATYKGIADSLNSGAYRQAETRYTTEGRLPDIQQHTVNARDAFKHAMQLLDEHGRIQLQAAYQRRLSSGGRGGGANRQQNAMIAALNDMERTQYGAQIRSITDQYNQDQTDYRAGLTDSSPGDLNSRTSNVTLNVWTLGPNGQPQMVHVPVPGGAGSTKTQVQKTTTAPQTGGGNPLDSIFHAIQGMFGGGGGGSQHVQSKNAKGQTIYSDDGGRTWHK